MIKLLRTYLFQMRTEHLEHTNMTLRSSLSNMYKVPKPNSNLLKAVYHILEQYMEQYTVGN